MFFKKEGMPEKGELVLCTVKKILPHAAFVSLDEYENLEAMLHVSEISSKWVKNIKEHLSENKKIVCKVLEIKHKGHIDVSLKRVTKAETKRKLEEIKTELKMEKLLEFIAKKNKEDPKKALEKIGRVIVDEFGSLAEFYNEVKKEGVELIDELTLPKKWKNELKTQISEQLKSQFVKIRKEIELKSLESDGVIRLRKIFQAIDKFAKKEDVPLEMRYISAPRYMLEISVREFKQGKTFYEKLFKEIEKLCKKTNVEFKLIEHGK
ncbi:MAG: S1 RNA-binding domain-containing protein [Nanoarchaeota archaeon]|nr:S1 RNA-binding domain-containing protein [Nanoarchaeota archaeon]